MVSALESLLFVSGEEGLTKEEIIKVLEIEEDDFNNSIETLNNKYKEETSGIELAYLGNRYKLITKRKNKEYLQKLVTINDSDTLSSAALEVLAIIAYNQPVTRLQVDEIRGINCSHLVRRLVYKNLIEEVGRSEQAGRPILYGTTDFFLDYFGLKSIKELPQIQIQENDTETDLYNSKYKED